MTRRQFVLAPIATALNGGEQPLIVPVRHIIDKRAQFSAGELRFFADIWAEATRDLRRCGIEVPCTRATNEIRRTASGAPVFSGLQPHVINMAITRSIPVNWDAGRGLSGVSTRYDGFHLCVVALNRAHRHQVPFLSVNTCLHELLHVLLQDIYEIRPKGFAGERREMFVDLHATRLWLLHDGAFIRRAAESYIQRLQASR